MIRFVIFGQPQAKGSARAFIPKGWKRPIITSTNKSLKGWESRAAAIAQQHASGQLMAGPVKITVVFKLERPKRLKAARAVRHTGTPDLDKLCRALGDALNGVLWHDDKQVAEIDAKKFYADPDEAPCADVRIDELATVDGLL